MIYLETRVRNRRTNQDGMVLTLQTLGWAVWGCTDPWSPDFVLPLWLQDTGQPYHLGLWEPDWWPAEWEFISFKPSNVKSSIWGRDQQVPWRCKLWLKLLLESFWGCHLWSDTWGPLCLLDQWGKPGRNPGGGNDQKKKNGHFSTETPTDEPTHRAPLALLYISPSVCLGRHHPHRQRLLFPYREERSSASPETVWTPTPGHRHRAKHKHVMISYIFACWSVTIMFLKYSDVSLILPFFYCMYVSFKPFIVFYNFF